MIKRFFKSVGYALNGLVMGIKEERNLRIDLVCMAVVFRLSLFYDFGRGETAAVLLLIFLIPSLELMNTAVERAARRPDEGHYMSRGRAKDAAAAGVFFMSLGAVACGAALFWDSAVFAEIAEYYLSSPAKAAGAAAFFVAAVAFVAADDIVKRIKR